MSHTTNDAAYYADALEDNTNSIAPLLKKMHDSVDSLTYDEEYQLRELLSRNAALVGLLNSELRKPAPVVSRWKTILRRK